MEGNAIDSGTRAIDYTVPNGYKLLKQSGIQYGSASFSTINGNFVITHCTFDTANNHIVYKLANLNSNRAIDRVFITLLFVRDV